LHPATLLLHGTWLDHSCFLNNSNPGWPSSARAAATEKVGPMSEMIYCPPHARRFLVAETLRRLVDDDNPPLKRGVDYHHQPSRPSLFDRRIVGMLPSCPGHDGL